MEIYSLLNLAFNLLLLHQAFSFDLEGVDHTQHTFWLGDDLIISVREEWGEIGSWKPYWFRLDLGILNYQSRFPITTDHPDYAIKESKPGHGLILTHMIFYNKIQVRHKYYDVDFYSAGQHKVYSIRYIAPHPWPDRGPNKYKSYKPWLAVLQSPPGTSSYTVGRQIELSLQFGVKLDEQIQIEIWREVIRGSSNSTIMPFQVIYTRRSNGQETSNDLLDNIWVETRVSKQSQNGIKVVTSKMTILPAEVEDKGFYGFKITGTSRALQDSMEFRAEVFPEGTTAVIPADSGLITLASPKLFTDNPELIRLAPRQSTEFTCVFFNTDRASVRLSKDGEDIQRSETLFVFPYGPRTGLVYRLLYPSRHDEGLYRCYSTQHATSRFFRIVYGD